MLLITESGRQNIRSRGMGATTPAPTTPASPTTPTTPGAPSTQPAPAGTSAQSVAAIVTSACGSSPNYCTWQSGANKDGYLQAFLSEAATTRFVPFPATSNNALMVMEQDARTNCQGQGATGAGGSSGAKAGTVISGAGEITAGAAVAAGAAAGSIVPIIGNIVGAVAGIIATIFAKSHASAVAGEQADICSAVPALNAALQQIDAGLAAGSITPSQAQSAYSQMQSTFTSALKQNTTYKTGDSLWAYNLAFTVVVQVRNQDLQNGVLTSGAPGPWTAAGQGISGVLGSLGISSDLTPWLVIGTAAALYFLL